MSTAGPTEPPSSPPPGWYPDPQGGGGQRYWDGSQWTEHTSGGAQQAGGVQQYGQAGGQPAYATGQPRPDPWLWQSILATIFCCLPLGVVGIIFAAQSKSAADRGELHEAQQKASTARTWTLVSVGLGLLFVVVWLIIVFVAGASLIPFMEWEVNNNTNGF